MIKNLKTILRNANFLNCIILRIVLVNAQKKKRNKNVHENSFSILISVNASV